MKKIKNIIYITGGIVAFSYPNFIYELEIKRNFKEFGYNLKKKYARSSLMLRLPLIGDHVRSEEVLSLVTIYGFKIKKRLSKGTIKSKKEYVLLLSIFSRLSVTGQTGLETNFSFKLLLMDIKWRKNLNVAIKNKKRHGLLLLSISSLLGNQRSLLFASLHVREKENRTI